MAQAQTDANGIMERMERGLLRGGEILTRALQQETAESFLAPTGELGSKVKADRASQWANGGRSIEVYARGSYRGRRGQPRRAETVAFVIEYGRRNDMEANPWNQRASDSSVEEIGDAIREAMFS